MRIAIDTMGGDYAPAELVKGALQGARQHGVGVMLVGPRERVEAELARDDPSGLDVEVVHTDEYLVEGEHPALTLRKKRNASILVAVRLIKEGKAQAAIGAGPTGGIIAAATQTLGTLAGIARPVTGGPFLGFAPNMILLDVGGNVDTRPDQLLDFAIVGSVYARKWLNIPEPTVALLSNGKEEGKGNETVRETYELFKRSGLRFVGNVEGNDLVAGRANVVVCDGFVGNAVVKFCEEMGAITARWLEDQLGGRLPPEEIRDICDSYLRLTVPGDTRGSAPVMAVNGVVCKVHGRSQAPKIAMTVGTAKRAVEVDLVGAWRSELEAMRKSLNLPGARQ